jgi:hypothetical protein
MRAIAILLLLAGCSGCTRTVAANHYAAPIIKAQTMPMALATTRCSLNNLPIILVDSATWDSPDLEIVITHEEVHARRAYAYRGGCWPYMYRIVEDKAFRAREQMLAFCVAGRFALTRNRNPKTLWRYTVDVMAQDSALTFRDNCLYEPWDREGK